ncbi:MAG TPA: DUF2075 domain-containing protein [Nitrososphaerales archaeon]|nr:DUF2075 domain-containing protein [Nitrososphaerales archaeon]
MRLYSGTSQQFVEDTFQNQIAEKLRLAFFDQYRYQPSPGEINSWRNSLRAISQVFQYGNLLDHGVILEYQLPLTSKRLDCLICGRDGAMADNAVIIELKQWEKCREAEGENEVTTWVGGASRELLHPSVQVEGYKSYLESTHTAFHEGEHPIVLNACAYLHNYNYYSTDVLFSHKFDGPRSRCPVFTADDVPKLKDHLVNRLEKGEGIEVLNRIESSKYRPSKKLMDHVKNMIHGIPEYILLDEQLVVYDKILSLARQGFHDKQKAVIVVKGGPGTGKSLIAINLMATLSGEGYNTQYATGSRAFTETLRKKVGTYGGIQFRYFNSYMQAERDAVDVLLADESHRIRQTSASRYTRKENRTDLPQIEELIKASKSSVFFVDDYQVVRPGEIGSSGYIREQAERLGCKVLEYELQVQFRCAGSDAFVNWVNNTLGIERTANVLWEGTEGFDFKIYESPEELEEAIRAKVAQGHTGRVAAGYCWHWSMPDSDGNLKEDVVIGNYRRPWDARPEARKLAQGIPKATLWADDPNGINQVGCVYNAQGFEFDYVGVIIGPDLRYDFDKQMWVGHPESSHDPTVKRSKERFTDLTKNTYRVLLSRGMKGCYVNFMDRDTERFFRSRMEQTQKSHLL